MPDRLLVVDDDPTIGTALKRIFSSEGYDVVVHTDPREAVAELKGGAQFPVVCCDYMMSPLSGADVLRVARETNPDCVRLLLTAMTDIKAAVDAVNQGAVFRIVTKPWKHADLIATIRSAFEQYHLRRRNRELTELVQQQNRELTLLNENLERLVQERTNALLEGMIAALDYRDSETQWHSRRVSRFTRHLAERMGAPAEDLSTIEWGALLHDIGKISIRDVILRKPGPLDEAEWAEMRLHPQRGWALLQRISYLRPASEIVLRHHERWDGSGYPGKLRGRDIPFGARVFAAIDIFDAITSNRPYHRAEPFERAVEEIAKAGGTKLDPDVSSAFVAVPRPEWDAIRSEVADEAEAETREAQARLDTLKQTG